MTNKDYKLKLSEWPFMRASEIAKLLNVSIPTWMRWIELGKAPKPVSKLGNKTTVWSTQDIRDYVNHNLNGEDN